MCTKRIRSGQISYGMTIGILPSFIPFIRSLRSPFLSSSNLSFFWNNNKHINCSCSACSLFEMFANSLAIICLTSSTVEGHFFVCKAVKTSFNPIDFLCALHKKRVKAFTFRCCSIKKSESVGIVESSPAASPFSSSAVNSNS